MWIATVFPHMVFFSFFYDFFCFPELSLLILLFFNIELVENYNCRFPYETLLIATVFLCMVFFSFHFFCYYFFQNFLCSFYFLNINLVKNLAL